MNTNIITNILASMAHFPFVLLNLVTILLGCALGHLIGKKATPVFQDSLRASQGLVCLLMGITSCMALTKPLWSMALIFMSCIAGEALHLEGFVDKMIQKIGSFLLRNEHLSEEFVTSTKQSLLVSITGALAAMASITLATTGDPSKMILKSVLDLVGCFILSCANGAAPILLSGVFIMAFQIAFFFLGSLLAPFATPFVTEMLSSVGGVLLCNIGLNLLGIPSKLRSTCFITAFILPFLVQIVCMFLNIAL